MLLLLLLGAVSARWDVVLAGRPERVNDFATPGNINLVCGRRDHWSVFSPPVVG